MAPLLLRFHLQGLGGSLYALGWCPSATHTCPNRNKTTRHKPDGSEQTNANPTKNNLNCRTIYNEGDGADTFSKLSVKQRIPSMGMTSKSYVLTTAVPTTPCNDSKNWPTATTGCWCWNCPAISARNLPHCGNRSRQSSAVIPIDADLRIRPNSSPL